MPQPRPLSELEVRATVHNKVHILSVEVSDELLRDIADGKISPSRAYTLVYNATQCEGCAKGARWLAIIARDFSTQKAHEIRELM